MTASIALLNLAKLGVPLATLGHSYRMIKKKKKKKKNGVKKIVGGATGILVGTAFTRAVYS